jgi:hypothetical protein
MSAAFALALLAIACSGYLTLLIYWPTRVLALRADSQRLIYLSSSIGVTLLLSVFAIYTFAPASWQHPLSTLARKFDVPFLDLFVYAFLAGPIAALLINNGAALFRGGRQYREQVLLQSLERWGDALLPLLIHAFEKNKLLQVSLKSRKVYCGMILEKPMTVARIPTHLRLLPKFSTVRNKDTLRWEREQTPYPAFEKYRLLQRIRVIDETLPWIKKMQSTFSTDPIPEGWSSQELQQERQQIESFLDELIPIDFDDWVKHIPIDQIESISSFDEVAYELWYRKGGG